jgi:fructooligosaccharide transport system substrate-binding protein
MRPMKGLSPSWLKLAAGLMLVVLIAGCAVQPAAVPTPAQSNQQGGSEATKAAEPASPGQQITVRFWMQQDNLLVSAMQDLINSFQEAHPNIKIQLDSFPFNEYHQKVSTAFAGNDAPDVFWMDVRVASFAQQGVMMPLDDRITKENHDDYLPAAWIETMYDGKTYGVPMHELTEAIYVNTQMAEDAGITLPQTVDDAWTWDQFVEAATKLTKRSGDQTDVWGFGVQRQLQDWSVLPVVYQHDGTVLSPDLKKATGYLNSPTTVEALTWYGDLFTKEKVMSAEAIPDGFPTGKIAMFQAPSSYRPVLDNNFPDFKYTVVPLFRDKKCSVMTGGWNVSISASTQHPDEAWLFLDWITRVKHKDWVEKSGYLPARHSVIDTSPQFEEYPWSIFMNELQKCPANRPPVPQYTFFFDTFKQAITDIAIGQDPQTTLDAAAQKLDAGLSK